MNAVTLLLELRELSEQQNRLAEFGTRLGEIRNRHQRKVSLLDRFVRAGLR